MFSSFHFGVMMFALIPGVNSCAPEGLAVLAPHVTPVVLLFNDMNII
jgi:hypothetical protein